MTLLSKPVKLALLPFLFMAGAAVAQPDARFTLVQTEKGMMRLDKENGQVSYCLDKGGQLVCEPSVDAILAYEAEIERLERENSKLRKDLSGLQKKLQGLSELAGQAAEREEKPLPRKSSEQSKWLGPEQEQQLDEAFDFAENAMRRFFNMVEGLKQDTEDGGSNSDQAN
ncbi:hypothetical protein E1162_16335 [Rhodobacteraceae bacterium RKSG542]|uniref:hypothetical protein n=1 Tax=Pseudovibrio flavus TaxID=2529854 RepID=UPI0012BB54BD|nr:hypothetical protein [Pseudovibrio flavus]MTI18816.1 hypothetical protein [Pseudovibrio flavus]